MRNYYQLKVRMDNDEYIVFDFKAACNLAESEARQAQNALSLAFNVVSTELTKLPLKESA